MMKRVISYFAVAFIAFQVFMIPSQALANEEVKTEIQNYATELGSLKVELTTQVRNFEEWSKQYAGTLKSIMTKELSKEIADAIVKEDYSSALNLIENALREVGEVDAANALSVLKNGFLSMLNQSLDYEGRLTTFLNANKDTVLVADMLPLIDEVRATYNSIRTPMKAILDTYYYAYYQDAENKLEQYKNLSISELNQLFEDLKDELYMYEDYANILNNKLNSWKQLILDLHLDGMGFEDLFYEDVRPYVIKMENLFLDVYHEFVDKQWTELRNEGNDIVNDTTKTIAERNQILLAKIDYYTLLRTKASDHFTELKSHISMNKILTKVKKLETKALGECDKAIEYVRSLLMVEDFDLMVKEGVASHQVTLDRSNHYLITWDEYDMNTFLSFLKVKNENAGELRALNVYDGIRIGTKSKVGVYQGSDEKISYYVILKGDVRGNGIIDISDVTYLIKTVLTHSGFDEIEKIAGDMNNDGNLDISDITATIKKALS